MLWCPSARRHPSVCQQFSNIFSETTLPIIKSNFMSSLPVKGWGGGGGVRKFILAATPMYGKTLKIFSRTRSNVNLKLSMQHRGLKVYKGYISDDPGLAMTYFTARSNLVACAFEWRKLLQSHLTGKTCSK